MKVHHYPHPILRHQCKPIQRINHVLRDLVAEMFQIMYENDGVGLAANQVGLPYQLLVLNPEGNPEKKEGELVLINPVILKRSGKVVDNEGCLSFPSIRADVVRAESITFEAVTLDGDVQRFEWKGLPARIVQHETDHLNGLSFIDRLSAGALLEIKSELADMHTVFEGDQRLGFIASNETIAREIHELEQRC